MLWLSKTLIAYLSLKKEKKADTYNGYVLLVPSNSIVVD